MAKIAILWIGKQRNSWVERGVEEYRKRIAPLVEVQQFRFKDDTQLVRATASYSQRISLDPTGKELSSEQFAETVFSALEEGGARLAIAIGGAAGLPEELKKGKRISLSKLTFPHQMARLILFEQLYRACEIKKGSCYHK